MKPKAGMGATLRLGSDAYPHTIIWVNDKANRIRIQSDSYVLVEGNMLSENQVYKYTPNPSGGFTYDVSLRKDGSWRIVSEQTPITVGHRRAYRDPGF